MVRVGYKEQLHMMNQKVLNPIVTYCEGSHKKLDVIPDYVGFKGRCGYCEEDMRPNKQGIAPKHPSGRMKFMFRIRYDDICQIAWHPISAGTKCRYFGVRLVCKEHV